MKKRINLLGVKFDHVTMNQAVNKLWNYIEKGNDCISVFTANPEWVMIALKDNKFFKAINQSDLVVADGIGIVMGSKIIKKPLPERIAGYDLVQLLLEKMKNTDKTVYFFGAEEAVVKEAVTKMKKEHQGLKIIGYHTGYYKKEDELKIVEEINKLSPDLLLVGLSMTGQVEFIDQYKEKLKVKVCVSVGGSFDVMSGNLTRAPRIFIKLNLEWLHRLIKEPTRFKRMLELPKFIIKMMIEGKKYK